MDSSTYDLIYLHVLLRGYLVVFKILNWGWGGDLSAWSGTYTQELTQQSGSLKRLASDLGWACQKVRLYGTFISGLRQIWEVLPATEIGTRLTHHLLMCLIKRVLAAKNLVLIGKFCTSVSVQSREPFPQSHCHHHHNDYNHHHQICHHHSWHCQQRQRLSPMAWKSSLLGWISPFTRNTKIVRVGPTNTIAVITPTVAASSFSYSYATFMFVIIKVNDAVQSDQCHQNFGSGDTSILIILKDCWGWWLGIAPRPTRPWGQVHFWQMVLRSSTAFGPTMHWCKNNGS